MALQLLDRNGNFIRGRRNFGGTVDDHVCLLLLFDGYRDRRCVCADDRAYFMHTLLNTHPFGAAYRRGLDQGVSGGLLVFSAPITVPSGQTHRFSPTCSPRGIPQIDETELASFIDGLSYYSFLNGRSTWLTPGSRSLGMVGVVLNQFSGRDAFYLSGTPPHFVVSGTAREDMARVFIHELGHAFELADEYEEEAEGCQATGSDRYPNVVYREAIDSTPASNPTSSLLPTAVRLDRVPWARYLSTPPQVVDHPRRSAWVAATSSGASFGNCVVGRYEQDQPSPQSLVALWEGGDYHSFNAYRAEPYCIMRDERYQVYDPNPPPPIPVGESGGAYVIFGTPIIESVIPPLSTVPCGTDTRDSTEARTFSERVGNSFVPYCVACEHFIEYRFGITTGSDIDEWRGSDTRTQRLSAYERWLVRNG